MQIPFELEMFNQMFLKIKWKIFHPTLTFEFSASGQKGHLIFLQIRISAPSGLNNKKVLFCWFHWISLVCLSGVLNFRAKRGLNKTVNWKGQIKLKFYRQIKFILQLRNTKHKKPQKPEPGRWVLKCSSLRLKRRDGQKPIWREGRN